MRYVKKMGDLGGLDAPLVYLAGGHSDSGTDWRSQVVDLLMDKPSLKGTILDPFERSTDLPGVKWEHSALWAADIVAFWFAETSTKGLDHMVLFELGEQIARFCLGCGPKQIVIGSEESYPLLEQVRCQLSSHNRNLEEAWKLNVSSTEVLHHSANILRSIHSSNRS